MPDPTRPLPPTDQMAADLSDLRALAQVDLPGIQAIYEGLYKGVAGTAGNDVAAFSGYGGGAGYAVGELAGEWTVARNLLQDALGASVTALGLASQAISAIADAYGNADTAARDQVDAAWRNGIPANEVLYPEEEPPSTTTPAGTN